MKHQRTLILFVLAISFGLAATLVARRALEGRMVVRGPTASVETTHVVVARADISIATPLSERRLDVVEWPREFQPDGVFSDPSALNGRVLRHALAAGEPVFEAALLPEGSKGGLLAVITEKKRAVSVKVDPTVGVAGFVTPGSRVDVLVTLRRPDQRPRSKAVLQNVSVLAIDQKLEQAKNGEPELVSVVTLEVSPAEAEQLVYSAHEGRLQLAMRHPADQDVVKTSGVSVSDLLRNNPPTPPMRSTARVEVFKGVSRTVERF